MLMHINSDVPNFRFSETQKPASVIPVPDGAGEIYSNNAEFYVSVQRRNRRSESQGNYSVSIGVEMLNPYVLDGFEYFKEINDFHWGGTQTMPDGFDTESETGDVMEAGLAFMMSFLGLQSQAEKLMDGLQRIMKFIEPFSSLISPMGVMLLLTENIPGLKDLYNSMMNALESGLSAIAEDFLGGMDVILEPIISNDNAFTPSDWPSYNSIKNLIEIIAPTSIFKILFEIIDKVFFGEEGGTRSAVGDILIRMYNLEFLCKNAN